MIRVFEKEIKQVADEKLTGSARFG